MKTIEEIQEEFVADYIFTTEEFEDLMKGEDSEIEFVDSFVESYCLKLFDIFLHFLEMMKLEIMVEILFYFSYYILRYLFHKINEEMENNENFGYQRR